MTAEPSSITTQSRFANDKYAVLRDLVPTSQADLIFRASLLNREHEGYLQYDKGTNAHGRYCDAMGEAVLLQVQAALEQATGIDLLPAYSYLRFYTPESRLPKHKDRPSCEISATMTIGDLDGPAGWPIWVETDDGQSHAIDLAPGDLMIYRGAEVPHWREPLDAGLWLQLFLHYVSADGPYTDYAKDQRERIGPVSLAVHRPQGINMPKRAQQQSGQPGQARKPSPMDRCPCGSGKPYAACHGRG